MEKKSKFTKKLINLFWGFIGAFPIIMFLIMSLSFLFNNGVKIQVNDVQSGLTIANITTYYNNYAPSCIDKVNEMFNFMNNSDLYICIKDLIRTITQANYTSPLIIFTGYCLCWYISSVLLHIVVDFILLLPNICKRFFRKVGGDYE